MRETAYEYFDATHVSLTRLSLAFVNSPRRESGRRGVIELEQRIVTEIAYVSKRQREVSNLGPLYRESDIVLVHSLETCCVQRNISGDGAPPPDQYTDGVAAALPDIFCRTPAYKQWLSSVVGGRGYKTVLEAACGTGVDSIQLLEEGYTVVSTDASEPMLAEAHNERRRRQNDAAFNNWETDAVQFVPDGKAGRNYDVILDTGSVPVHNVYYKDLSDTIAAVDV
ncbi:Glycine N-methyltransferase [Lamellibrachia satsuma]|nr:Glycine N-methyltransferase [Lamellibrachia satsuma]